MHTDMSVREAINNRKGLGVAVASGFVILAVAILVITQWPARRLKGDKVYFTDDDGQTWFLDSVYRVPPYDHNGKKAVRAAVFSYDQGNKTYCAYLVRYNADAKKKLEDAVAEAAKQGKGPETVALFSDPGLNNSGAEVKLPGPNSPWVLRSSSDGSNLIDQGISTHSDASTDLVVPQ